MGDKSFSISSPCKKITLEAGGSYWSDLAAGYPFLRCGTFHLLASLSASLLCPRVCVCSSPLLALWAFDSLAVLFLFLSPSKPSGSEWESSQSNSRAVSFSSFFSSSPRSDTKRSAGSEPRAVPRSPAIANHSCRDDGRSEVRDSRAGGWEGHCVSPGGCLTGWRDQALSSEYDYPGLDA